MNSVFETIMKPAVLFWSFLVIALLTLPAATFLCEPTIFMVPLGGIGIIQSLIGGASVLPEKCQDLGSMTDLGIHLVILSILVSHVLTILVLHFAPKTEEPHLLSSRSYLWLIIKTLFTCTLFALAVNAFAWWSFQTPEIATFMRQNTNLQSPAQTMLTLVVIISLITIILSAWHEDRFAFWDATAFCLETLAFVYEATFLITGIDLIIVLLSLPFPAFADHFNPFFPPLWQEWYADFK